MELLAETGILGGLCGLAFLWILFREARKHSGGTGAFFARRPCWCDRCALRVAPPQPGGFQPAHSFQRIIVSAAGSPGHDHAPALARHRGTNESASSAEGGSVGLDLFWSRRRVRQSRSLAIKRFATELNCATAHGHGEHSKKIGAAWSFARLKDVACFRANVTAVPNSTCKQANSTLSPLSMRGLWCGMADFAG